MAEWTGTRRTINSLEPEGPPPVDAASDDEPVPPEAPGATSSPQLPGMTPDCAELPGWPRGSLPPLQSNRRPIDEYLSAQQLLQLFTPPPDGELQAADWEQGPVSGEERRKADPALLTPPRPLSGYGLGIGRSPALAAPSSEAAIEAGVPPAATPPAAADPEAAAPVESDAAPAVGNVPVAAVRGDGTFACPPDFPIKGNAQSMIYHTTASPVYGRTIPEFCFATVEAAEAAGFRASRQG